MAHVVAQSPSTAPKWILRYHSPSPIHALRLITIGNRNEQTFVLAGDGQGRVSFASLNDLRPRYFWEAHPKQSVLGLDVIALPSSAHDGASSCCVVTQGRDNLIHVYRLNAAHALPSLSVLPTRIQQDLPEPDLLLSLDINALNYCPFSALHADAASNAEVLLAVPHTLDSGFVDVISLPSKERVARAIGQADIRSDASRAQRAPMCMTMHLLAATHDKERFRILAGYEDGYMRLWSCACEPSDTAASTLIWATRRHTECIMASAVHGSWAVSVAADEQVVVYDVARDGECRASVKGKSMGNASVCIRKDGKRIAVGGWDGHVRIYDDSLQHVSTLRYHKETAQTVGFAEARDVVLSADAEENESDSDDDTLAAMTAFRGVKAADLLVTGGKEGRICLWTA